MEPGLGAVAWAQLACKMSLQTKDVGSLGSGLNKESMTFGFSPPMSECTSLSHDLSNPLSPFLLPFSCLCLFSVSLHVYCYSKLKPVFTD